MFLSLLQPSPYGVGHSWPTNIPGSSSVRLKTLDSISGLGAGREEDPEGRTWNGSALNGILFPPSLLLRWMVGASHPSKRVMWERSRAQETGSRAAIYLSIHPSISDIPFPDQLRGGNLSRVLSWRPRTVSWRRTNWEKDELADWWASSLAARQADGLNHLGLLLKFGRAPSNLHAGGHSTAYRADTADMSRYRHNRAARRICGTARDDGSCKQLRMQTGKHLFPHAPQRIPIPRAAR